MRVYSPYTLLSITKMTGSFQIAAKFSDSWNAPIFVAASPKSATPTFFFFWTWKASAAPTAIGIPPPIIADVGSNPTVLSHICIEPPTPPAQPVALPIISAITECDERPNANATPWLR